MAVREYLDKNMKWRFDTVCRKLGKLNYLVKLKNGKQNVDQLRANKSQLDLNSNIFEGNIPDQQNATSTTSDGERPPVDEIPNADCVRDSVQVPAEGEMEENAQEQALADKMETRSIETNVNTRPQRIRKAPSRYGDFLTSY